MPDNAMQSLAGAPTAIRTTGFVESDGEQIYYESVGEGEAVILGHGLGGNHAIWYQQVPELSRSRRVIVWDQRGFGRSTNNDDEAGPVTGVKDLERLLDHLELEKAHLVGQSMGGWTVLGLTMAHPERAASITLADTIGGIYTPAIEAHFDAYLQRRREDPPADQRPIGRHFATSERLASEDPAQAYLYEQIGSLAPRPPATIGPALRATSFDHAHLSEISCPALFIVGEEDPIFPPAVIREAATLIAGARVVEIPEAAHSPYFSRPRQWNAAMIQFLESVGV